MLTFFCINTWQTCQKAKAWLSQQNIQFNYRNIAKEPPQEEELQKIAQLEGLSLKQLVNTKGLTFRKLKPDLAALDDSGVIKLIQENPSIMIRPVLMDDNGLVIGFSEDKYGEFIRKA